MGYRLRDLGYKWKTITQGKHNVGRVWQHVETKRWHGMIGKHEATGDTAAEAFYAVASLALGYESHEALRSHNRQVRHENKARRAQGQRELAEFLGPQLMGLFRELGRR